MFDEKSLNQLRGVIREEVRDVVREIVRVEVRAQIHEVVSVLLNEIIMPQFEYIHARIDRLEARMTGLEATLATKADILTLTNQYVRKGYLEDRLDTFRIDHGLKYKKA
ncbi:hypothetical protein KBC55_02095 [Patescibacteria group bacterium]|nr:hypothetical protein [Patescibacteria group bacterium]